jgi:hypothetical protein
VSYNGPALPVRFKVCKEDFAIWDRVLARLGPTWLDTMSRESDRRDADLMRWREQYRMYARRGVLSWMAPADSLEAAMRIADATLSRL